MLKKIVSGGQTGADKGGLKAARLLDLNTGGWAPLGWRTELGSDPGLADFGLLEAPGNSSYHVRTAWNVRDSDGTLIFGDVRSAGSSLTLDNCLKQKRPFHLEAWRPGDRSPDVTAFQAWLAKHDIEVLNVAGNRESRARGIEAAVISLLLRSLASSL